MTPDLWAQVVLWVPCAIGIVVAAVVAVRNSNRLTNPMGLPKWDFTQSWASNITVVGGVVSFTILTTLLSKPVANNKDTWLLPNWNYAYLVVFFPALVALAPIIYNFTREIYLTNADPPEVKVQGRTFTFLFTAALTVWGAAGQVEIQAGLVMSLWQREQMPLEPTIATEVLFFAIFVALLFYSGRTMEAAVRSQPRLARRSSIRLALAHAQDRGWPLL